MDDIKNIEAIDNKAKLKAAQKHRATVSGISVKEGGSLTMPGKWVGIVSNTNASWGDWTNYAFPIHDKAHADNAAARLAQNSEYSDAEKSKISARIVKAQKKFGEKKTKACEVDMIECSEDIRLVDSKLIIADIYPVPDSSQSTPTDYYTRDEVHHIVSNVIEHFYSNMDRIYARYKDLVNSINEVNANHCEGHLPSFHPGQVKAILTSAGIADDFHCPQEPMSPQADHIYGSMKDIKIDVK